MCIFIFINKNIQVTKLEDDMRHFPLTIHKIPGLSVSKLIP